jgi:hypothetical protein
MTGSASRPLEWTQRRLSRGQLHAASAAIGRFDPNPTIIGSPSEPLWFTVQVAALFATQLANTLCPIMAVVATPPAHATLPVVFGGACVRLGRSTPPTLAAGPVVIGFTLVATTTAFAVAIDRLPIVPLVPHQSALRTVAPFPAVLRVAQLATPLTAAASPVMSE